MANAKQLALLKAGVEGWNRWREKEPKANIDLRGADLRGAQLGQANLFEAVLNYADLGQANLSEARLRGAELIDANLRAASFFKADLREAELLGADLFGANLNEADLSGAGLSNADLRIAHLSEADLSVADFIDANLFEADLGLANLSNAKLIRANLGRAILIRANLTRADLREADLREANLSGANLSEANLSETQLSEADLSNSHLVGANINNARISKSNVYGVNIWDLEGEFKEQRDLVITPNDHSPITVDNIKVAQFVYLILNNKEIRDVINTLTSKTVLILGRFTPERKAILDALRDKLREHDLLPIIFDFDRPIDKDFTETIKTLAGLCYFVIADVTNPKSSPLELQATVPDYQIPFVPIIQEGEQPFAMMVDLHKKYNWVLEPRSYDSIDTLMKALKPGIIDPAMKMQAELRFIKAKEQVIRPLQDFIDKS